MKRKAISFILSIALIGSFSLNVKAVEMNNSTKIMSETMIVEEEQTQEDTSILNSKDEEVSDNEDSNETPAETPVETSPKTSSEAEEEVTPSVDEVIEHSDRSYDSKILTGDQFTLESISKEYLRDTDTLIHMESDLEEGFLNESHIGEHLISITYEDADKISHSDEILIQITGKPVILLENEVISDGELFELELLTIKATDHEDGDLSDQVVLIESEIPLGEAVYAESLSSFTILLSVADSDGNEVTEEFVISVEENLISSQAVIPNAITVNKTITLSGENRYKTATAISQAMYQTTDVVILVSANNFPDALAAGPLAKTMNAPILLTGADSLSGSTAEEIKRLGATKVIIMGGLSAVSKAVEETLKESKLSVERIAGDSRYTTAIAAAKKLGTSSKIILANGDDFADAMTAGSYASMNQYPIILTRTDQLNKSVKEYIDSGIQEVVIMGGESAISGSIESELIKSGIKVIRIAGSNRFNTSVAMAEYAFSSVKTAVVANGMNFVDALTAVPYAASMGLPVILINKDSINTGVKEYLVANHINYFHFIGGESALSQEAKNSMMYPSLYELTYRTADTSGTWLKEAKNGEPAGNLTGNGLSKFEISTSGDKDIRIRYGISLMDSGWQEIADSGSVGITGRRINGLIMELKGTDAKGFDVSYRAYIEGSGWTQWTLGGNPLGSSGGKALLAIEAKIIRGNALVAKYDLFPAKPNEMTYAYSTSALNLRSGEGSSTPLILRMQNRSYLEIISVNTSNTWAKVNYTARGITYEGYVSLAYVRRETHVSKAIVTMDGIKNGDTLPASTIEVKGDAAYNGGISEINYYINGVKIGQADYGYLSSSSILHGFNTPMKTGYRISIPASQWKAGTINSLKIEVIGKDGRKEWTARYLNGDSKVKLVFEPYAASFNYYLDTEHAKKAAVYGSGIATRDQISAYLDPTTWATHDTYRYMFLDLGYSKDDYAVTVAQMDAILKGKGILNGTGSIFLQGAIDFNINPFYLIAHAILETGHGTSVLVNGQQIEHYHEVFGKLDSALIPLSEEDMLKKWYNVFGIGAYDGNANLWGAERAYHQDWDTIEKAIHGGAGWIASGYINRIPEPQNSNYKMRYNLKETMSHQYATDVMWAYKQASNIKRQFDGMGFDVPLKFIIPTFGDIRP